MMDQRHALKMTQQNSGIYNRLCVILQKFTQQDSIQIFKDTFMVISTSLATLSNKFAQKFLHCISVKMKYGHL